MLEGVFVGTRLHTGKKCVATSEGVCKTRSIRRRPEDERWKVDEIIKVTGTPWKAYLYTEKDGMLSKPPPPAVIRNYDAGRLPKEVNEAPVPQIVAITQRDSVNYGRRVATIGAEHGSCEQRRRRFLYTNISYTQQNGEMRGD